MGTTNILDLNNRVNGLAGSYPADKVMLSDGVTSVEDALDAVMPRTTSGTTIAQLVSAIGQLTDAQKIRCDIYINDSFVARFVKPNIYNCIYSSSNGTTVELSLEANSSTLVAYTCTGTSRTATALAVSTWTIFYSGTPIS